MRSVIPAEEFIKKRYIVERNGQEVYTEYKTAHTKPRIQLFFATQLQKVDGDSEEIITTTDAETLNRVPMNPVEEKTKTKTKPTPKKKPTKPKPIEDSPETKPSDAPARYPTRERKKKSNDVYEYY